MSYNMNNLIPDSKTNCWPYSSTSWSLSGYKLDSLVHIDRVANGWKARFGGSEYVFETVENLFVFLGEKLK